MRNRLAPLGLLLLLAIVHGQLWIGRGSIPSVNAMGQQLADQRARNAAAQLTNQRLEAEVRDLREGMEMVEEKARFELGMVRPNEVLVLLTK